MSRALIQWRRTPDGDDWEPCGVWLCTVGSIQSRHIPGNAALDDFFRRTHAYARRPYRSVMEQGRSGTWEDWADWALDALSDGHGRMVTEVEPALSVDALYAREVTGGTAPPVAPVPFTTTMEVPDDLGPSGRA